MRTPEGGRRPVTSFHLYVLWRPLHETLPDFIVGQVMRDPTVGPEGGRWLAEMLAGPAAEILTRDELDATEAGRRMLERWEAGGDAETWRADSERADVRDRGGMARILTLVKGEPR